MLGPKSNHASERGLRKRNLSHITYYRSQRGCVLGLTFLWLSWGTWKSLQLWAWHLKGSEEYRKTADTILSWPNPKQWVIVHTSDLMMIIRQSIYILSIIIREMGILKTYSLTYCIMDNGENMLNLTHTRQNISERHFIISMPSDKFAQWW